VDTSAAIGHSASVSDSERLRLLDAFAYDVDEATFERWIAEWSDKVERRTFHSNIVDVTIDFMNDSVDIEDVLAAKDIVHVSSIAEARRMLTPRAR